MHKIGSKALVQYRGTNIIGATTQVMVEKFAGWQMSVSGCPGHDNLTRKQDAPAKTVTSLLMLPSVLAQVYLFWIHDKATLE